MTGTEEVIDQADALMRRYRSFVARSPATDAHPADAAAAEAHDIPVLTDIVSDSPGTPREIEVLLESLHESIGNELTSWLAETLPLAVASASQHIIAELDAKAQRTLLPRLQALLKAHPNNIE